MSNMSGRKRNNLVLFGLWCLLAVPLVGFLWYWTQEPIFTTIMTVLIGLPMSFHIDKTRIL